MMNRSSSSRVALSALLIVLLSACAGAPATWRPPAGHPADPEAPAAALAQPSATLALADDDTSSSGAPTAQPPTGDHAEHQHDGKKGAMGDDGAAAPPAMSPEPYLCPMHPEVGAQDPAARCPKCGMKLVPREEVEDQ